MRITWVVLLVFLIGHQSLTAQNVGIGTTNPSTNAILDIQSNNKGVLLPRMTSSQRNAISSPEIGLMVFDTDKGSVLLFDGTKWQRLSLSDATASSLSNKEAGNGLAGDYFGAAVDIYGDYAVVGAFQDDVNGRADQGSVYIFQRVNGVWNEQAQITANDGLAGDLFGCSVAIFGDFIVVGAKADDIATNTDQGSAYIFQKQGSAWVQIFKLADPAGTANDNFGEAVDISIDRIIVGAPGANVGANDNQGTASVYLLAGSTWGFEVKLTGIDGGTNNYFGGSVAVSFNTVLVGAVGAPSASGFNKGAAYLYSKIISSWSFLTKLISTQATTFNYGSAVALDGNTAVVSEFASSLFPQPVFVGRVNVYLRTNVTTWPLQQLIENPIYPITHKFGKSVSVSGDLLIVGSVKPASNPIDEGTDSANVSVFKRTGTEWNLVTNYFTSLPAGAFGTAVALQGFNAIMGAPKRKNEKGEVFFCNLE